jgi:hypothetical protein
MDFLTAPNASGHSLTPHVGGCPFVRHDSALDYFSDPDVGFRVNLIHESGIAAARFQGTRTGNTLSGSFTIEGDTLAGHLTAALCTTCPNSSITTSIAPSRVDVRSSGFTLVVNGTNFSPCSVVRLDDVDRATTFHSESQITAQINDTDLLSAGVRAITVFTPTPGGGRSNVQELTVGSAP